MKGKYKSGSVLVIMMFLMMLCVNICSLNACAPAREFNQDVNIPANDFSILELQFQEGDELELIFSLQVKQQDKVIDVWFVNYANYVRLVDGNEFLFFIDGSAQEISEATKIVSVTQHDAYALVLANYNNTAVDVSLAYDINIYPLAEETEEEEEPLWEEYYVMLPLGLVIGIIVGLLVSKAAGRIKGRKTKAGSKAPSKKGKTKKPKKEAAAVPAKKKKIKRKEPVVEKKEEVEEPEEETEVKEKAPSEEAVRKSPSTKFCGNCGSPVTTKFCPDCGEEVGEA